MLAADKKKLDGIATGANAYTHPTTSGNKHIPSGGSSGQILRWSADGTATWGADYNTTYSVATSSTDGLTPKADASAGTISSQADQWVLTRNGTAVDWYKLPANAFNNSTYSNATTSTAGLVKVSSVNSSAVTVNSESTTSGRYYPIELNSDGKAIVNVPWTDGAKTSNQNYITSNENRPLLMGTGAATDTQNYQAQSYKNSQLYANPSTGIITANAFSGKFRPNYYTIAPSQYEDALGQIVFYVTQSDSYGKGVIVYAGIALGILSGTTYTPVFTPSPLPTELVSKLKNISSSYVSPMRNIPFITIPNGEIYLKGSFSASNGKYSQTTFPELFSMCERAYTAPVTILANNALFDNDGMVMYGGIAYFRAADESSIEAIEGFFDDGLVLMANKGVEFSIPFTPGSSSALTLDESAIEGS
jgi:hypothetical protein